MNSGAQRDPNRPNDRSDFKTSWSIREDVTIEQKTSLKTTPMVRTKRTWDGLTTGDNAEDTSLVHDQQAFHKPAMENRILDFRYWMRQCKYSSPIIVTGVDAYFRGPTSVVSLLIDTYFESVHPTFPIITQDHFKSRVHEALTDDASEQTNDWLAVFNLVLAISSKYLEALQDTISIGQEDHHIYFIRAYMLGMAARYPFPSPTFERIQITGLMSIYFLCTNQFKRYNRYPRLKTT